jgi:hypothetical protein
MWTSSSRAMVQRIVTDSLPALKAVVEAELSALPRDA